MALLITIGAKVGRDDKIVAKGERANESKIGKRDASAGATTSGKANCTNICDKGKWRQMLVKRIERGSGNERWRILT
ncbi:hypothetical protein Tco_1076003, partial [Tanacetum coccineum]